MEQRKRSEFSGFGVEINGDLFAVSFLTLRDAEKFVSESIHLWHAEYGVTVKIVRTWVETVLPNEMPVPE